MYGPDNKFRYTQLGKRFYSRRQVEVVIQIPIRIKGRRENGTYYIQNGWMPSVNIPGLDRLWAREDLTPSDRNDQVRQQAIRYIRETINAQDDEGNYIVHEHSDEVWTLNPAGQWRYSEMETRADATGAIRTKAVMGQSTNPPNDHN